MESEEQARIYRQKMLALAKAHMRVVHNPHTPQATKQLMSTATQEAALRHAREYLSQSDAGNTGEGASGEHNFGDEPS